MLSYVEAWALRVDSFIHMDCPDYCPRKRLCEGLEEEIEVVLAAAGEGAVRGEGGA